MATNAACVLDCLAAQDAEAAGDGAASSRWQLAANIRQEIVDVLGAKVRQAPPEEIDNWVLVTLGEAAFGLQQFDEARHWLMASARRERPEWTRRTTATQLTALLRLMAKDPQRAVPDRLAAGRALLAEYLGHDQAALDSVLRGKIGLALSGGGFRASFFHLGVMARLAELDLLRHVECLSCVSGGSIVGAHFYLELKKLLEDRHDVATPTEPGIAKQDYIDIVRRVQRDFLAGVQTNVRTRVAADLFANLRMIFRPSGSRTLRVGELYEEQIFARVNDDYGGQPRWLDELLVQPKGAPGHFRPEVSNWRRFAKVPTLVLNATTLNTGHCWQFTANWMGEALSGVSGIDANARLRRVYHHDLPAAFDRVRLGHAVAASACVPGLFEPLTLRRLYRGADGEDMLVRLVDGGVHDNQGVATLVDEDCAVMIVSDGSQQMDDDDRPGSSVVSAPLRSNDILQERVRTAQHAHLDSRRRGGLLRGLAFLHLKQGLDSRKVDWIDCQDPSPAAAPIRCWRMVSSGTCSGRWRACAPTWIPSPTPRPSH